MAVATTKQIREALKAALVAGLGEDTLQISAYVLSDPNMPTVWVRPRPNMPFTYHQTFGVPGANLGLVKKIFLVEVYCGGVADISAQQKLDEFVDDGSIPLALEKDLTLGGVVQNLTVTMCNAYVEFRRADGNLGIGANWELDIYP